jgi:cytochrome b involved in lipid metabolism
MVGKDATKIFEELGHSDEAREVMASLLIGVLHREVYLLSVDPR